MMNLYEKELLKLLDDTTIMNPLTLTAHLLAAHIFLHTPLTADTRTS